MSGTVPIYFNDKKSTHKIDYHYIQRTFVLVTIFLLEIGTICHYCIKHCLKQKTYYHNVINNI